MDDFCGVTVERDPRCSRKVHPVRGLRQHRGNLCAARQDAVVDFVNGIIGEQIEPFVKRIDLKAQAIFGEHAIDGVLVEYLLHGDVAHDRTTWRPA